MAKVRMIKYTVECIQTKRSGFEEARFLAEFWEPRMSKATEPKNRT